MTQFLKKSFKVHPGQSEAYRNNYDRVFGRSRRNRKLAEKGYEEPTEDQRAANLHDIEQQAAANGGLDHLPHPGTGRLLKQTPVKK